ncbi:hypothetical protein [Sphingomonas sp. G-3-2-10]|nr:hypothetical protein [Sphingomonas sp. G-3-2-10]NML05426.1 hypothetical protein [Sphingomonas sp. G-3-2-10]
MTDSRNMPKRTAQRLDRAVWQRPEVRRVRAGGAETTTDSFADDVVFS